MKTYLLLGLVLVALGVTGCQNATSNSTDAIVGTWAGTGSTSGFTMTVSSNNTWVGSGSASLSGAWSKSGSTYTFTPTTTAQVMAGVISGNSLTLTAGTSVYTFSKS